MHSKLTLIILYFVYIPTQCEIISRKTLFDNPKYSLVTISPDGSQIAYLAPNDFGISNVFVRSIVSGKERPATFEMKNHISGEYFYIIVSCLSIKVKVWNFRLSMDWCKRRDPIHARSKWRRKYEAI